MTKSITKGKVGEREFAHLLIEHGFAAHRGQQHAGGTDSPDVVCEDLADIHWEVKRVEALNLRTAMEQAARDAGQKVPVVAHRRNKEKWIASLPMADFLAILKQRVW